MPTRFIDAAIVYRILRMLVTPFDKTDAYKLGIIDAKGKILKKERQLNTQQEKNAYTLLHRLVFRLKRIIEKVPLENKKFLSFAAALALIRENYENGTEPIELESMFLEAIKKNHDTTLVEQFMTNKYTMTFKQYIEEDAPANSTGSPGGGAIAGIGATVGDARDIAVPARNKLTMLRRKKPNEFSTKIK